MKSMAKKLEILFIGIIVPIFLFESVRILIDARRLLSYGIEREAFVYKFISMEDKRRSSPEYTYDLVIDNEKYTVKFQEKLKEQSIVGVLMLPGDSESIVAADKNSSLKDVYVKISGPFEAIVFASLWLVSTIFIVLYIPDIHKKAKSIANKLKQAE